MAWLRVCAQGLTMPMILDGETMAAERYIEEVLPLVVKRNNKVLGKQWTYQQDGAKPYMHQLTQNWGIHNFPDLIPKSR